MFFRCNKGFTLVELLVVISIIGVLAVALVTQVTKAGDQARAMKCKANLRNLAQAAQNYAVEHDGRMPYAGSYERCDPMPVNGRYRPNYWLSPGWVAWTGPGRWSSLDIQSPVMKMACYFGPTAFESITNGCLWSYVGKDLAPYVCDAHKAVAKRAGLDKVLRSYVMNSYFGFDNKYPATPGALSARREIYLDALAKNGNAGNLLLFAELPAFLGSDHKEAPSKAAFNYTSDCVLEADISGYSVVNREAIGFNHKVAKRYVAHVAFADGHVDVLIEPKDAKDSDLKELTKLLCNGNEISQTLRDLMR